jgi:hypothetical protein
MCGDRGPLHVVCLGLPCIGLGIRVIWVIRFGLFGFCKIGTEPEPIITGTEPK